MSNPSPTKIRLLFATLGLLLLAGLTLWGLQFFNQQQVLPPMPSVVSRQDPPKLVIDQPLIDLGTVVEGVEIPYTATFSNVGGEPLEILDVSTSCGCTLLNLKDKVIAPGKTGELDVVMDTAMKQGPVRKTIELKTNDPDQPSATMVLQANVLPKMTTASPLLTDITHPTTPAPMQPEKTAANPHANLGNLKPHTGPPKLFVGQCATCHVQKRGREKGKSAVSGGLCNVPWLDRQRGYGKPPIPLPLLLFLATTMTRPPMRA